MTERDRIEMAPCPTCGAAPGAVCLPLTADAVSNFSGQRYSHIARRRLADMDPSPVIHTGWPVGRSPGA